MTLESAAVRPSDPAAVPASGLIHVLMTRFNLPSGGIEGTIRTAEGWLVDRVRLFETYCLPSVEAQTRRKFHWIVYFDPESPAWLREWTRADRQRAAFAAIFRRSVSRAEMIADIRSVAGKEGTELLTTNLDNDDALAADFVARLQDARPRGPRTAIYVRNGIIKSAGRLYLRADPANAFCSVRESAVSPVTCWSDWHNRLGQTMPVTLLDGAPGWLQVVHGRNVSNRVKGRRVSARRFRGLFPGMLVDLPEPTCPELLSDALVGRPARGAVEAARSVVKRAAIATMGRSGPDRARKAFHGLAKLCARRR